MSRATIATAPAGAGAPARPSRRLALSLLVALVTVDAVLIGAHLAHALGPGGAQWLATSSWSVERDRGVPEIFGYGQFLVLAVGLLVLAALHRQPVYRGWALFFAVVVLDDQMMVHERGGRVVVRLLGSPTEIAGLRAQDVGELAVWAVLGAFVTAVLLLTHLRSDSAARARSRTLAELSAVFLFFGLVLDQVHGLADEQLQLPYAVNAVMGTIEDGGELVSVSVIVAFVVALAATARAAERVPGATVDAPSPALA